MAPHLLTSSVLAYLSLLVVNSQFVIKSEVLTATNNDVSGASVETHLTEVDPALGGGWEVNVNTQNSWQFIILLDRTWGFNPTAPSSIRLTVASESVATGPVPSFGSFDDLLFGFTTDNA